jgi:hypothetical protein
MCVGVRDKTWRGVGDTSDILDVKLKGKKIVGGRIW